MTDLPADLTSHLMKASRALVELDAIDVRDESLETTRIVCGALMVFIDLRVYQQRASLPGDAAARLQNVSDRLRARLRFFGESV